MLDVMIKMIDADSDQRALRQFLALPSAVYQGDPHYCARPKSSVLAELKRARFHDCQRVLLAIEGGECVARVVARRSPSLKDEDGNVVGTLGLFEALDRPRAIQALLQEGVRWLRESGAVSIVGPMDGDTWHSYRFNVGPFDCPPFLMEPYNKPYYPETWEASGFEALAGYYSLRVDDTAEVLPLLVEPMKEVLSSGYSIRRLRPDRFHDDLRVLYNLSRSIFAENLLYDEISWEDFVELYEPARSLVDPDLVWFARAPDGDYIGFCFSLIDVHKAVVAMRGSRSPLAKLRFLLKRGQADAVNVKSLGVVNEHRRSGIGAALLCRTYEQIVEKGFRKAHHCLIRDGNPSGRMGGDKTRLMRRYTLYRFPPNHDA